MDGHSFDREYEKRRGTEAQDAAQPEESRAEKLQRIYYAEALSKEERAQFTEALQKTWGRAIVKAMRGAADKFGAHARIEFEKAAESPCYSGVEIDAPVTGTKPHLFYFGGKREVTGRVHVRGGKGFVQIYLSNNAEGPEENRFFAVALALRPDAKKIQEQLSKNLLAQENRVD